MRLAAFDFCGWLVRFKDYSLRWFSAVFSLFLVSVGGGEGFVDFDGALVGVRALGAKCMTHVLPIMGNVLPESVIVSFNILPCNAIIVYLAPQRNRLCAFFLLATISIKRKHFINLQLYSV